MPSTLNFQSLNEIGVPINETEWTFELSRLDMVIASDHLSGLRSHTTDIYLLQYMLLHTVLTNDTVELADLAAYASANGYDVETAFLHYYDDTAVTYSDGTSETIKGYGGGTASTLKDARVKNHIWTSYRYVYNLKSPLFQKFKGAQFRKVITTGNKPDGIFVDEVSPTASYFPTATSGGKVIEYGNRTPTQFASEFQADMTPAFASVNAALGSDHPTYPGGDRVILPNVAEYVLPFTDLGTNGADGLLTEYYMQVVQPRVIEACDLAKLLADRGKILIYAQGTPDPEVSPASNYYSARDRHEMFSLSNYWLAKQGRYTYYQQKAGSGSPQLSSFWAKAREFDIGTPADPLYSVWKTGTDSAGQSFTIYKRAYTNGLILSRPKVGWTYSDYGTQSQLYDLDATYRLLHSDGTLGPEIGKIGLAMGEAVTLVRTSSSPPPDTTAPTISGVASSNVGSVSASIGWTTNEPATGTVEYGTTTSYGSSTAASTLATGQSVTLLGLSCSTTYHYRVTAMDAAGNRSVSSDYTFTTQSSAGGGGSSPSGFIRHWAALGPFIYTNGAGHNTDYIGETTIHPSVGVTTAGKTWTDYASSADLLDLCPIFSACDYAIGYLNCYVYSPVARNCQFRMGVDDAAKVFFNGALIYNDPGYRPSNPDADIANVTMNAGWNQLLIKAENFTVGWTLYARFTDTAGQIIPELTYHVDYPATTGGSPKLAVTITANKKTAKVGEQLVYTVNYTNTGDGAATSAVVKADVDPHVSFVSASNGGIYDAASNSVKWNVGTVAPGANSTVTYTVVVK